MSRMLIPILMTALAVQTLRGEEEFRFVEKHDLGVGSYKSYATLKAEQPSVQIGKFLTVDISFFNTSGGDYFYNPFFCRLIPLPAQLALYDSQKKYVGDLIEWLDGSQRPVLSSDWTFVYGDSHVGTKIRIPIPEMRVSGFKMVPGDYFVQMIFYNSFTALNPARIVSTPPRDENAWLEEFYKKFDRRELFRSNPIKITVVQ